MSSGNDGEWVRQGTPRDADWDAEQSEYGTALNPAEWNDYTSEQSVQVTPPASRARVEVEPDEEDEAEPTTRVVLSDPDAPVAAHALPEEAPRDESAVLRPMPAPPLTEPVAPARAATTGRLSPPEVVAPEPLDPVPVTAPEPVREPVVAAEPPADPVESDDDTSTQEVPLFEDVAEEVEEVEPEPTVAVERERPRPIVPENNEAVPLPAGVFRDDEEKPAEATEVIEDERTEVIEAESPAETTATAIVPAEELDAERRIEEQVAAERAARNERLGVVATSRAEEVRAPQGEPPRNTDRPLASFGLLFLRLVVAGILGIIGYQILTTPEATAERLATTVVPQPQLMTWVLGFTLGGVALCLVIGLLVRVSGVVMVLLAIASLVLYRWGAFSPFLPGVDGFLGDRDLLLGAVGVLFIALGGGAWGIDGAFRRARARSRAERS